MKRAFKVKQKAFFITFKGLSFAKNCLRPLSHVSSQTDKVTSVSKESKDLHSNEANNETTKERYISPQERQQIIHELRLI